MSRASWGACAHVRSFASGRDVSAKILRNSASDEITSVGVSIYRVLSNNLLLRSTKYIVRAGIKASASPLGKGFH